LHIGMIYNFTDRVLNVHQNQHLPED